MSANPWGAATTGTTTTKGIGSWAEQAELEELEAKANPPQPQPPAATYPSLKESVTSATTTTKKEKKKKMTLADFNKALSTPTPSFFGSGGGGGASDLPTGPKMRGPDDMGGSYSRGFGGGGAGGGMRRERERDRDYDMPPPPPSRADEVDNWAVGKKSFVGIAQEREKGGFGGGSGRYGDSGGGSGRYGDSGGGSGRYGDLGGGSGRYGDLGGGSRADEVDNWSVGKKVGSFGGGGGMGGGGMGGGNQRSGFGSGFRDSGGSDWRKERGEVVREERPVRGLGVEFGRTEEGVVKERENKGNPFGAARPREEVLKEKGVDWKKMEEDIEAKKKVDGVGSGSRPTSSQGGGSRPTSSQSNRSESAGGGVGAVEVKPRPKVNPFGEAKPREVLLQEKGLDWRKIDLDLEHRGVDRAETEQEKALKEEIESLKKELEKESAEDASKEKETGGEQVNLQDVILSKEKELETLIRELDDKVRFRSKVGERPGSGSGRFNNFPERPGSGSGGLNNYAERPGSGSGRFNNHPERPGSGSGRFNNFAERPGSGSGRYNNYPERPPSQSGPGSMRFNNYHDRPPAQSGSFDGGRGPEAMDRPRSRGSDTWSRPGEDRRGGFQGRGFMSNRDFDRSRTTNRW